MKDKPNYYAIIPADVRYDKELRANEKLLFGEISALTDSKGECYASNNYFANLYEVVPSAISRWIKDLEKKKYIEIEYIRENKEIKQRKIKTIGIHKCEQGYSQKVKGNKEEEYKEINKESNIFELVEKNLGRVLSPIEIEVINKWDYDTKIIELAIRESILNNAKTIKYIDRVLFNWKQNKVETLEDAERYIKEFSNKSKPRKKKKDLSDNYYKEL